MLTQWRQRLTANKGYTIDQTILIVAVIAILITLIIITIGWQLIGRASGTKLGAQLRQIEDANGTFYSDQKVWPNQAFSSAAAGTPANNIALLLNQTPATLSSAIDVSRRTNQLPGLKYSGGVTTHGIGGGDGVVTEQVNTANGWGLGSGKFMVVQFTQVPLTEAGEADEAIDGNPGSNAGRLVYGTAVCLNNNNGGAAPTPSATPPSSGVVNVCYAANAIQ